MEEFFDEEIERRQHAIAKKYGFKLAEHALHLYQLNRGVLVTPFHNMMLTSPAHTAGDVARLLEVLAGALDELGLATV